MGTLPYAAMQKSLSPTESEAVLWKYYVVHGLFLWSFGSFSSAAPAAGLIVHLGCDMVAYLGQGHAWVRFCYVPRKAPLTYAITESSQPIEKQKDRYFPTPKGLMVPEAQNPSHKYRK